MGTVITIMAVVAFVFGVGSCLFSGGSAKERATEAAGAAAGGALLAGSCLFQLILLGLMALAGLWLLGKIFG